jgi:hypothetical protein
LSICVQDQHFFCERVKKVSAFVGICVNSSSFLGTEWRGGERETHECARCTLGARRALLFRDRERFPRWPRAGQDLFPLDGSLSLSLALALARSLSHPHLSKISPSHHGAIRHQLTCFQTNFT